MRGLTCPPLEDGLAQDLLLDRTLPLPLLGEGLQFWACSGQKLRLGDQGAPGGWTGSGAMRLLEAVLVPLEGAGAVTVTLQLPLTDQLRGSAHCRPARRISHSPPTSNSACTPDSALPSSQPPCIRHLRCQPATPPAFTMTQRAQQRRCLPAGQARQEAAAAATRARRFTSRCCCRRLHRLPRCCHGATCSRAGARLPAAWPMGRGRQSALAWCWRVARDWFGDCTRGACGTSPDDASSRRSGAGPGRWAAWPVGRRAGRSALAARRSCWGGARGAFGSCIRGGSASHSRRAGHGCGRAWASNVAAAGPGGSAFGSSGGHSVLSFGSCRGCCALLHLTRRVRTAAAFAVAAVLGAGGSVQVRLDAQGLPAP